ncbi:MAG: phosphate ABC transporter, permease protein PstA, partial [Holophagaceae bacterium]
FWPSPIAQVELNDGSKVLGILTDYESATANDTAKYQFRVGNRDLNGLDFRWIEATSIKSILYPKDIVLVEREEYGYLIGRFESLVTRDLQEPIVNNRIPHSVISKTEQLRSQINEIRKTKIGKINQKVEANRLTLKSKIDETTRRHITEENLLLESEYRVLSTQLDQLETSANQASVQVRIDDGRAMDLKIRYIVRYFEPNNLNIWGKSLIFFSRINEFLSSQPRESNTEGGVFPAIFGTVLMVLIMSILVVPLGVIAAIYLKEYARNNLLTRSIRIAVNNLAGVPSIVFGVFGLGFFVYGIGGSIDQLFYSNALPAPTFGTGGILWASLTLALLTIPVVIVATEESIAAIPR